LVAVTSSHGTFGNLVYTQMNFLPVLQLASVFGVWGVTFCVLFFAAAVAALLSGAGTAGQRQMFAATAGLLMLVPLTLGWWRVHFMPKPEHSVTVGLLASDLTIAVAILLTTYRDRFWKPLTSEGNAVDQTTEQSCGRGPGNRKLANSDEPFLIWQHAR